MLHSNLTTNERGHLCLAGRDVCDLADKYSTPLFLMDEERIRNNCRNSAKANGNWRASSRFFVLLTKKDVKMRKKCFCQEIII